MPRQLAGYSKVQISRDVKAANVVCAPAKPCFSLPWLASENPAVQPEVRFSRPPERRSCRQIDRPKGSPTLHSAKTSRASRIHPLRGRSASLPLRLGHNPNPAQPAFLDLP